MGTRGWDAHPVSSQIHDPPFAARVACPKSTCLNLRRLNDRSFYGYYDDRDYSDYDDYGPTHERWCPCLSSHLPLPEKKFHLLLGFLGHFQLKGVRFEE